MIEIIFGRNGAGKSLYKETLDTKWYKVDKRILKWQKKEESNVYSDYYRIYFKYTNEINDLKEKIFSKNSSILLKYPKIKLGRIHKLLKELDFLRLKKWQEFENKAFRQQATIPEISSTVLQLWEVISENKNKYLKLTVDQIKKAIIFKELFKIKTDNSTYSKDTKYFYKKVERILHDLIRFSKRSHLKFLVDFSLEDLRVLNEWKKNRYTPEQVEKATVNVIKWMIIQSKEYRAMKQIMQKMDRELQNAFRFERHIKHTKKDGKILDLNRVCSYKEGLVVLIDSIAKTLESKKRNMVIDNILDYLDDKNEEELLLRLSERRNIINIMIRKAHHLEKIQSVLRNHEIKFATSKIDYKEYDAHHNIQFKRTVNGFNLTFQKLNQELIDDNYPNNFSQSLVLFARIFGRYVDLAGALANSFNLKMPKLTSNYLYYDYVSQNIMHYEPKIYLSEFRKMFNVNLKITGIDTISTIDLIDTLISYYKSLEKDKSFGIEKDKIVEFLHKHRQCIVAEKLLWNKHGSPASGETKHQFIKKHWPNKVKINGLTRQERNKIEHSLDNSLMDII